MATPTQSWDEGSPSGIQAISLLGERLREIKTQFREIFAIDHIMSSSGSGNSWGYHNKVTLYNVSVEPLADPNTGILFAMDVASKSELHWVDEDDNGMQWTSNGQFIAGMVGEVRMYRGAIADIPEGWEIADGLCAKFIRGVATNATNPGSTGGADSKTLTSDNITAHTHTLPSSGSITRHLHTVIGSESVDTDHDAAYFYFNPATVSTTTEIVKGGAHSNHTLTSAGSGTAYDNRPAFIEEGFIIKV